MKVRFIMIGKVNALLPRGHSGCEQTQHEAIMRLRRYWPGCQAKGPWVPIELFAHPTADIGPWPFYQSDRFQSFRLVIARDDTLVAYLFRGKK